MTLEYSSCTKIWIHSRQSWFTMQKSWRNWKLILIYTCNFFKLLFMDLTIKKLKFPNCWWKYIFSVLCCEKYFVVWFILSVRVVKWLILYNIFISVLQRLQIYLNSCSNSCFSGEYLNLACFLWKFQTSFPFILDKKFEQQETRKMFDWRWDGSTMPENENTNSTNS